MDLSKKRCVPCEGGVKPLRGKELEKYMKEVKGWNLVLHHPINETVQI